MKSLRLSFLLLFVCTSCSPKPTTSSTSASSRTKKANIVEGEVEERKSPQAAVSLDPKELADQYLALKASVEKRKPILEKEQMRRQELMLALMANIGAGCMGNVSINTVEIIVDGEKLTDNDVTALQQNDQYLPQSIQGQTNFEFTLGDSTNLHQIKFTNNEQQTPLFSASTHFTYTVPQANQIKINLVDTISIKKTAPAYSIQDFCKDYKGKQIEGCTMQSTIKELERYLLSGFTIKVNGNTLYTRSGINHVFAVSPGTESEAKVNGLMWQDMNTQLNPSYVKLLQTANCPQQ